MDVEKISMMLNWAKSNEEIRTIILTNSLANPEASRDLFSDFNVELFVNDLQPFLSDEWVGDFGTIVSLQPLKAVVSENWVTRLVLYEDGVRIDFQISTNESVKQLVNASRLPPVYDNGYKVLLDKDNLTHGIKPPSYSAFVTKKPTEEEYTKLMNDFWWNATYAAKNLLHDERYFSKFMLDNVIRFNMLFQKVTDWYIGVQHGWNVNPNKTGRWLKSYLDTQTWRELETIFAETNIENNWNGIFRTADLFKRLGVEVGTKLGYPYPYHTENNVRKYLHEVKKTSKAAIFL
ncbi:aminoglycoside 6-adenylyltransferase [Metabacillus sp. Hm71]|uniref:aminoglycoside 6-adenylyltransferase n=1 Tax=Metabacillus sp. Hm71 TaxID=3450743 RepID=UPI003F4223B6